MERILQDVATDAVAKSKVVGYLCVDNNTGLCLAADGVGAAEEKKSGIIASIIQLASQLDRSPVLAVSVETDKNQILIQSKESVTTALYKTM